jgi:hypothetical protein
VGSYAISKNSYTYGSNYNETFVGANLVIGQRPITITVNAGQFKYCGQSDPVFSYTASGLDLASGDQFAGGLTRTGGESVGNYNILLSGLSIKAGAIDKTNNYSISLPPATFEIKGVIIDASASGNSFPLGGPAKVSAIVYTSNGTTPVGSGVSVTFNISSTNGYNYTVTVATNSLGVAESTLPLSGLGVNLYKVIATTGTGCGSSTAYLSVYDPNAGFVTGGGWIMSPAGAYAANVTLTGKSNFGFNAQYKNGSNAVDGNN